MGLIMTGMGYIVFSCARSSHGFELGHQDDVKRSKKRNNEGFVGD